MGEFLFTTLGVTLILMNGIELFTRWYREYLQKRHMTSSTRRSLLQIMWLLTALLIWRALYKNYMPAEFTGSHMLFALFVFSLRGLTLSFFRR